MLMEAIKAYFLENKQKYEYGTGQTNGQSRYINECKDLILTYVSKGYSKEISPHILSITLVKNSFRATLFSKLNIKQLTNNPDPVSNKKCTETNPGARFSTVGLLVHANP